MKNNFEIEVLEKVTAPLLVCPDQIMGAAYHHNVIHCDPYYYDGIQGHCSPLYIS